MDISEIETLFGKVDINNNFIKVLNENTDKIDEDLVEKLRSIAKSSVEDEETLNFFKNVSHQISENKYDGWDQTVVNQLLLEQDALTDIPITHSMFEQMFVWASMSDDFKRRYPHNETNAIETIFAIKIFAGPGELLETQTENIAWRINAYKELGFIDEN